MSGDLKSGFSAVVWEFLVFKLDYWILSYLKFRPVVHGGDLFNYESLSERSVYLDLQDVGVDKQVNIKERECW